MDKHGAPSGPPNTNDKYQFKNWQSAFQRGELLSPQFIVIDAIELFAVGETDADIVLKPAVVSFASSLRLSPLQYLPEIRPLLETLRAEPLRTEGTDVAYV
ncbi:MAG TPA: hypothetical protein VGJ55_05665 [Pyrinomonadaceae bacterium]|jgi:hypothetical protein